MGTNYYWCIEKPKVRIWVGRNINKEEYDKEEVFKLIETFYNRDDDRFESDLFDALREKKEKDISARDKMLILQSANTILELCMLEDWKLRAYFLDILIGNGEIKSDYDDLEIYEDISSE